LSAVTPLGSIPVGVIVERVKGTSQWVDYLWRRIDVLIAVPETEPWTKLTDDGERATFYAGAATIELHRTETPHYRENLNSDIPCLWVALRPSDNDPPYELWAVTADPAEGEALTEAGDDLIEMVPMPPAIQEAIAAFDAEYHVERAFVKRKRDRADPHALARRSPATRESGK
jgi:hypothetical protein